MKRLEIDFNLNGIDVLVSLARYQFVLRTHNNREAKVLDFGCGSGYGSRLLKERFAEVVSFDVYPDDYKPKGIDVINDLSPYQEGNFDIITCFEVIEHVDEAGQEKLMQDLHRMMTDNGTLYISTVRKMDPPPTENRKIEHIRELDFEELLDYCNRYFHNVYTFGQIDQTISTFYPENHYHFVFICSGKK
ncbi:class I SAM-dependent methyltransferase [bacterium SCSIO 12741]|nr:class I SAM-dependent methyltransferase [bacterium SCSIO 12741]